MHQLQYVVVEILLEFLASKPDAVIKRLGTILGDLDHLLNVLKLRALVEFDLSQLGCLQLIEVLWVEGKQGAKDVLSPLYAVKCFFGEHLECAVWDSCVLLRVCLRSVGLCLEWNDHLNVSLRTESAAIEQRNPCVYALRIDKNAGLNVVQCVRDHLLAFEKIL